MANSFIIRRTSSTEGLQLLNVTTEKLYSAFSNYPSICYDSNNSRFLSLVATNKGALLHQSSNGQDWTSLTSTPAQIATENFRCLHGGTYAGYLFASQNINLYRKKPTQESWEGLENTGITTNDHAAVAYNPDKGIIVSGGYNGTMIFSEDGGDSWQAGTAAEGTTLTDSVLAIIYIPTLNRFISCGTSGKLYSSADGKIWSALTSPADVQLNSIAYADSGPCAGYLVVCSYEGGTYYSLNGGTSWIPGGTATPGSFGYGLAYGNGVFVSSSFGGTGFLKYSTDKAVTWIDSKIVGIDSVVFNNGTFVAIGQYGGVWYSTNGKDWTSSNFPIMPRINSLCKSSSELLGTGYYGYTCCSSDEGKTWQSKAFIGKYSWTGCCYLNNMLFVFGAYDGTMQYSENNGSNWTPCTGLPGMVSSMAFGGSTFVSISNSAVYTSTDGKSWAAVTGSPSGLQNVVYNSGCFTAVDTYSKVFQSPNGTTWDFTPKGQVFDGYAYSGKLYTFNNRLIYVKPGDGMMGTGTIVYYSTDNGSTWKQLGGAIGTSSFGIDSKPDGTLVICGNNSAYYNVDNAIIALNSDIANVSAMTYIATDNSFIAVGNDGIISVSLT